MPPLLTVVIPCYNEEASYVERCVKSVLWHAGHGEPGGGCEVVLVDDASTNGCCSTALFAKIKPLAEFVQTPFGIVSLRTRAGASHARNVGAVLSRGEVLLFLDAHVELEPKAMTILASTAYLNPTHLVTGDVRPLDDPVNESAHGCGSRLKDDLSIDWMLPCPRDENPFYAYEVPISPGAMTCCRKWLFRTLGGYDEGLGLWGFEDVDLSLRAWGRWGSGVLCDPRAALRHKFKTKTDNVTGEEFETSRAKVALTHFKEHTVRLPWNAEGLKRKLLSDEGYMRRRESYRRKRNGLTGEQVLQKFGINWGAEKDSPVASSPN